MSNEMVREELSKFIKEKGIKQKFIADLVKTSPQNISQFLKGNRNIHKQKLLVIHQYIIANN